MTDDDPVARMRAEMDQAREGVREIPRLLGAFYKESLDAGFSEAQAFRLTLDYMAVTFAPRPSEGDNG